MSSSPFIKRAKGRSNIRSRDTDSLNTSSPLAGPSVTAESRSSNGHGEDDDEGEGGGMSPMLMAKNRKKDKDRKKVGSGSFGKSKLSFGVDDEVSCTSQIARIRNIGSRLTRDIHISGVGSPSVHSPKIQPLAIHVPTKARCKHLSSPSRPTRLPQPLRIHLRSFPCRLCILILHLLLPR